MPRRIAAVLADPPRRSVLLMFATAAVLAVATLTAARTAKDVRAAFVRAAEFPAVHEFS